MLVPFLYNCLLATAFKKAGNIPLILDMSVVLNARN
jgi:hypothetical protein